MKPSSVVKLLVAVVVSAVIIFFSRGNFSISQKVAGTAVLHDLSLTELTANLGTSEWNVIEDRVYEAFPSLSRSPRIARRIVAQATLPDSDQSEFVSRFHNAGEEWIESQGAVIKGEYEANQTHIQVAGGQFHTSVDLPRRYYALDDINGVADFGCIADSRRVTLILSIIEGD